MGLFSNEKTFKPKKKYAEGSRRYELHKLARATLGAGDLTQAVKLPPKESLDDWLAVHCVDFYNLISMLYGSVSEFCSRVSSR
jgi:MOB kinase activator 1